ncbi:MAG: hypothetical protein ACI4HQ_08960 [Acetatifactor sp.]
MFDAEGTLIRAGGKLELFEFDSKALETILSDIVVSEEVYKALIDFQENARKSGIDVWFCITDY